MLPDNEIEDEDLVTRVEHCRVYMVDGLRLDLPIKDYKLLSGELNKFYSGEELPTRVLEVTTVGGTKAIIVVKYITTLVEMNQEYTDKVNASYDKEKKGF